MIAYLTFKESQKKSDRDEANDNHDYIKDQNKRLNSENLKLVKENENLRNENLKLQKKIDEQQVLINGLKKPPANQ